MPTEMQSRKTSKEGGGQQSQKHTHRLHQIGSDEVSARSKKAKQFLGKTKSTKYSVKYNCNVSIVMFNAQSLRSKFDEFRCFVAIQSPDIVCVTETWVSEDFYGDRLQDYELPGYNLFSYCRKSRQGGGVFIYVNSLYCATKVGDPVKAKEVESVWIDVKISARDKHNLRIGAFYRAGNLLRVSQIEVDKVICEEISRNFRQNCLILGDFNLSGYDGKAAETNHECKIYKQLFEEELCMHQLVTEPTRQNSILDLVFSDNRGLVRELAVSEGLGSSDHNMITFYITSEARPKDNFHMVPNFNQADFNKLRKELAHINWKNTLGGLDTCEAWSIFKDTLNIIQNKYIPLKHKRSTKKQNPSWLTPEVRKAIRDKSGAFKMFKGSMSETNKIIYRKSRDEVKKKVRAAKRAKELDLAKNCNADSKKFFSFYKISSVAKSIGPLKANDRLVGNDTEMVELLSEQFESVFTIEDQSNLSLLQIQPLTEQSMVQLGDISSDLVRTYLKRVKPNKAEGPDEVYARILKECEREISVPLAIIFTKSLSDTEIPVDWKRANVVPIFKKGDKCKVENYRPVSLTSLVCKVLESIIKDKMLDFLNENDLIRDTQHGFRKGRSCLTNLLAFFDVATESFDKGKQLDVSYLDFSKAFDKVPHKRLGLQLNSHGIKGKALNWIESWLSGRQQRVVLNGTKSEWKEVRSGVPQGSVLGPLLFLIFINTIENGISSNVLKFADDLKVFRMIEDKNDQEVFQSDLDKLLHWSEIWQMNFNHSKCKIMQIGRVNNTGKYELSGQEMEQIQVEKDLGVMVNTRLSASDQVIQARKKALGMLGAINRNVCYTNEKVITKLYCAYVRPTLEYCVQAWSPTYEKDCWLLERVQKRATKMVNGIRNLEYEERLKILNMFSLKYRRLRGDLIEVFKFVNGQHVGYLKGMFEFNTENRGRSHEHKLIIKHSRTRLRQSFFSRRVVSHWNNLPGSVANASSLLSFKVRMDEHFTGKGLVFKYSWE